MAIKAEPRSSFQTANAETGPLWREPHRVTLHQSACAAPLLGGWLEPSRFVSQEVSVNVISGERTCFSGTNSAATHATRHFYLKSAFLSSSFDGRENVSYLVHFIEHRVMKVDNLSGPTVHLKTALPNSRMHYAFFDGI